MSRIAQHFFDRNVKALHRKRTARLEAAEFDVHRHFARTLRRRIDFLKAGRYFPDVLELGVGRWPVLAALIETDTVASRRMKNYTVCDISADVVEATARDFRPLLPPNVCLETRTVDEELLSGVFAPDSFDAVFTSCSAHWVNNLDRYFSTVETILKPDGLFLGCMLGGETLVELNSSFLIAERSDDELHHGVSPHVSPFVGAEDVSNLLMNTGFKLPLVDAESCTKWFESPLAAMKYVQRVGEGNAMVLGVRKPYTRRATFHAAMEVYKDTFAEEATPTEADPYATYMDDAAAREALERAAETGEGFEIDVEEDEDESDVKALSSGGIGGKDEGRVGGGGEKLGGVKAVKEDGGVGGGGVRSKASGRREKGDQSDYSGPRVREPTATVFEKAEGAAADAAVGSEASMARKAAAARAAAATPRDAADAFARAIAAEREAAGTLLSPQRLGGVPSQPPTTTPAPASTPTTSSSSSDPASGTASASPPSSSTAPAPSSSSTSATPSTTPSTSSSLASSSSSAPVAATAGNPAEEGSTKDGNDDAEAGTRKPKLREKPIPATFEAICWLGYKYHPTQPIQKVRGAKAINLQDVLSIHAKTGMGVVTETTRAKLQESIASTKAQAIENATRQPGVTGSLKRGVASASAMVDALSNLGSGSVAALAAGGKQSQTPALKVGGSKAAKSKLTSAAAAALGVVGDEAPSALPPSDRGSSPKPPQ